MDHMMTFQLCNECGFSHPPLRSGEKCPMAKDKTPTGDVIDYNSFFASLKNILTSQIQQRNIKDSKKFLGHILLQITKFSEEFSEEFSE